jgi:hypothetical protein
MKYQIKLTNGTTLICDSLQIMKNNSLSYVRGTLQCMIKEEFYDPASIERVRVSR